MIYNLDTNSNTNTKITQHDIKTYVINLERCKRKRRNIKRMLDINDIKAQFYEAVNAAKFTDDFIRNNPDIDTNYKNWCLKNKDRRGHLGCSYSHYNVLQKFINENNEKYLLIFEDDCVIGNNFYIELLKVLNNPRLPFFDILLGGYNCDSKYFKNSNQCKLNKDYEQIDNLRSVKYFIGMHCYLISRENAPKILKDCKPFIWCLDHQLSGFISSKEYQVWGIFNDKKENYDGNNNSSETTYGPIAFAPGNNDIPEWNFFKKQSGFLGSQTNVHDSKECFNGSCKDNNWIIILLITLFVIIIFYFIINYLILNKK